MEGKVLATKGFGMRVARMKEIGERLRQLRQGVGLYGMVRFLPMVGNL